MRKPLVCIAMMTASVALHAQQPPDQAPGCARAKAQAAALLRGRVAAPRADFGTDTDVLHYLLDLELQPASAWLGGTNTMTVRSLVDGLTLFRFRLHDVLTITDVQVGGTPASWTRIDSATVQVTLDRPYNTGEQFVLYVAYHGYPQGGGMGGITFRLRNGAYEVYTLSEPWFAYTWWPAKDDLGDKTTADLWFTVPDNMVVASNGLLQGVDALGGGKLRYRWKTNYPTEDYLYCIGATNYHQFGTTWDYQGHSMPLSFFIYPEDDTPAHQQFWLSIGQTLATYSDLFGIYPFVEEKYGMLEFGWGGGMEHQTITSIGGYFNWEDGIVHEAAHQWWGDNVTCATWHDIWLNEGFATYCQALWVQYKPGSSGEAALHAKMATLRPSNVSGTVYCYDISNVDRIFDYNLSYLKAGWVLHMLRHVLGDTNFFATLAAYRAAFQGRAANTEQFRQVAESVCGRDLIWFFDQWIYQGGAPKYQYGWQKYVVDGAGYVELYVKQTQSAPYPVFTMPIDIATNDPNGTHTHTVWNDAAAEHLLFQVESTAVSSLTFDPKPWILWTGASQVAFVQGPPKIVTTSPAPGEAVPGPQPAALEIVFHKDVIAQADDFTLLGQRGGPVSFDFAYDPIRHAVHLTPGATLPTDTYTLTALDSIVDTASGKKLDGELVKPDGPEPLPTGDGLPGGNAEMNFYVLSPGDLNCDGLLDFNDISPFVQALGDPGGYGQTYAGCPLLNGDVNGDGTVNFDDIDPFVALLSSL